MKNSGYLIIDRNIESWEFLNKPLAYALWNHLLRLAAWKDTEELKRGEIIISIRKLSEISGITREVISKWFSEFENAGQIHVEQCGRQLKITLLNYEKYNVKVAGKTATTGRNSDHSESNPSLFNRNNEEIECIKKRNTYKGECVEPDILEPVEFWFRKFWDSYPKRKAINDAERSFRNACKTEEDFRKIMAGLERAKEKDWKRIDPRYIPHPAKWLDGKRWQDEDDPEAETSGNVYVDIFTELMKQEGREE